MTYLYYRLGIIRVYIKDNVLVINTTNIRRFQFVNEAKWRKEYYGVNFEAWVSFFKIKETSFF